MADVSFTSVRKIPYITTIVANTSPPRNPFIIEKALPKPGMVSMSITLNALSLSDIFEMETTLPISILSPIKGKILDYEYAYVADEVYWKDTVRNVSGMYDCDAILFTPMRYSSTEDKYSIAYHATRIAAVLGKKLNFVADNFTHSGTWTGNGQTYNSIISSLFGWTSSVPQRQINVFMRAKDNSLNIIQRGKEKIVTDITDTHHTRAEYKQELERTLWSTQSSGEEIKAMCAKLPNVLCEPQGFTGTMSFGDSSASYSNGYLMSESKGDERTTYSYIGSVNTGKYLSRKSTSHADGSSTTTVYSYSSTASGAKVLGRESETHIDKDGNITTRDTYHVPLGNGFYGSSVSVDGQSAGSSISTGSPSGAASRYIVQQESYTLGGYKAQISGDSDHMNNYDGDGFIDYQSFPVEEESMLLVLTNAVKWLNRKVKETVTMEIYGYSHVLDFTERLRFNGAEYFLESNTITQTVRELKQSVTMVRWF